MLLTVIHVIGTSASTNPSTPSLMDLAMHLLAISDIKLLSEQRLIGQSSYANVGVMLLLCICAS